MQLRRLFLRAFLSACTNTDAPLSGFYRYCEGTILSVKRVKSVDGVGITPSPLLLWESSMARRATKLDENL